MTKIARNTCYGEFSLSDQAKEFYQKITGIKFIASTVKRDDPVLVRIVEELGEFANGVSQWWPSNSDLEVVEIPDDVNWYIDNYDGIETIREIHRSW